MNKITLLNGHPNANSLNNTLAHAYLDAAKLIGAEVRYIQIGALDFNPNLMHGYTKRMPLEPDLLQAIDDIKWADHLVFIHPIWWLGMPAVMKGFFDRVFLPTIAFKHLPSQQTEGLFQHKTARIITTAGDLSETMYEDNYQSSGLIQLEKGILAYCGITTIAKNFIGPIQDMSPNDIKQCINLTHDWATLDSSTF